MTIKITPDYLARSGTEDGHQTALFCYALSPGYVDNRPNAELWKLLFAIPNGGEREAATAARMVAMGARRGYPDIGLDVARGGFHGLRVELKRPASEGKRKGRVETEQTKWHTALREQRYCVKVCYGWQHAVMTIEWYLAGANNHAWSAMMECAS